MRYLDTGSRDPEQTLYRWLEPRVAGARYFACQTGYFGLDGFQPFEDAIIELLEAGGELHLVLGSNEGGLASSDLRYLLGLMSPYGPRASLTVVGAADVLMHAKTYYIEGSTGRRHALVGSCNLTGRGLASNIEAALAVDSDTDPSAPFDEIRDAILAWPRSGRSNAQLVTEETLADLVEDGAVDRPSPTRPPESTDTTEGRRRRFPPLGRLLRLPRPRRQRPGARTGTAAPAAASAITLPGGAIGIVKALSRLDTKGFRGEGGTLYIALPKDLADLLPLIPAGRNDEPRMNLELLARLDTAPGTVISSGVSPTNITYVGVGSARRSNPDLRLNFLRAIARGIQYEAAAAGVDVPKEGDMLALEFLGQNLGRLTFVTADPLKGQMSGLITERRGA